MLIKKVKQIIPVVAKVVSDLTSNSETDVPSVKAVNEGITSITEKIEWIADTEGIKLRADAPTVTIPHNFDDISEFSFRILGTDKGTFGYTTIPKEFWHNSGTYQIIITAFRETDGTRAGYATLIVQNKTDTSFEIHVSTGSYTNVTVAYKLK